MSTIFGFDQNTVNTFDTAYWAAQPIPVQALKGKDPSSGDTYQLAMKLAGQGYFIDVPIMLWNWDPYMTMYQRGIDGYTTYPDALNTQIRKVSLNLSDYPAVPVPTPPQGELIGPIIGFGPYYFPTLAATQAAIPAGTLVSENGHNYEAIYIGQLQIMSGQSQQILRWLQTS